MSIIGIAGRKRAGKDTLASALATKYGYERVSFADPLKAIVADVNPIIEAYDSGPYGGAQEWRLHDELHHNSSENMPPYSPHAWEAAKTMPEVRRLLQALGTACREHIDSDVWIKAAMRKVTAHQHAGRNVVIPDVRFPNEAEAIKLLGGIVVRINRPGVTAGTAAIDLHPSETAMDNYPMYDAVIDNETTPRGLANKAGLVHELAQRED